MEFNSQQLSSFLGVDIEVDPTKMRGLNYHSSSQAYPVREMLFRAAIATSVVALSISIAAGLGFCFLYFLEIGPFRP
jgi:hypothetical protein